jgi:hypothetical protein
MRAPAGDRDRIRAEAAVAWRYRQTGRRLDADALQALTLPCGHIQGFGPDEAPGAPPHDARACRQARASTREESP